MNRKMKAATLDRKFATGERIVRSARPRQGTTYSWRGGSRRNAMAAARRSTLCDLNQERRRGHASADCAARALHAFAPTLTRFQIRQVSAP